MLLTACRLADKGDLDLDKAVEVPKEEKVGGTGVLSRLSDGLVLPLRDLLMLMMIVSDNTATNISIDQVGISNINETLAYLQCTGTSLERRLMDLEARKAGRDNYNQRQGCSPHDEGSM